MNRRFGIELEIAGINREQALNAMRAVGIKAKDESYNHVTRQHWKLVGDTSVSGGFEVVSPVLEGDAGIREAEIVARALDDMGATVNGTCGFHVHFDARGLKVSQVRDIVLRYARHEDEIDAFMPRSRRGNSNQYCRSIRQFLNSERFAGAATTGELAGIMGSRYFKVNLESMHRHGTIEFRQHSGTVNAAKISNWIRFLAGFIDATISRAQQPAECAAMPPLKGIYAKVAAMLEERGEMRLQEMMDAFGWLAHTARATISIMRKKGAPIKSTKINGELAYRLERSESADSLWLGIDREIASFYQRRARVLALAA